MQPNIRITLSLKKFGRDVKSARLRRRLSMAIVAERAGISVKTLYNLESGDPGVSIGNVAAILHAMGMGVPFSDMLDQKNDTFGLLLDDERLPKRVRLPAGKP